MDSPNLERGIQLFEMGRYQDAITYFQTALSENVDNFTSKYYLAQCFFQNSNIKKALSLALELRSLAPNDEHVYFLLSQIYLHNNDNKEAEKNIDKAIEINPYDENFFGQKSYILLSQKKFEYALEYANEGLKINAKSIFCLNARTTALTKLNKKEEASSSIEFLLNDNPEDAHSHANVGWSHLENNDIKKALTHFKESLTLNPNLEFARSGMVTAVKSKNKIYNLYLRYVFWMGNKSDKNQWIFIIGIYLIYRFSLKILSASGLTYLAIPLIILYLLFALGSWVMDPLSNMLLMLDNHGKYLLDKQEKLSGQVLFSLLISSFIMLSYSILTNDTYFTILSLTFLATILPFTAGVLSNKKNNKTINLIYGSVMLLIAILGSAFSYPTTLIGSIIAVMFIAYTWLGSFLVK
ncbi:tetratricopeptide repeat protein [Flavivirga aquimarina]|uniref:Tetratricopeptide repeat protein n=1 Tax=Flavivirga aquimarina TaxID=2027862 RepID=A0ABT8WEY4_9FLAO|nr:tetratricopeptide repeat protein [Flavivirga aquimarina]MDO5971690.1 tetratricopeptide repeat protein [Flavivirga aquimarina]